ncbi:MAG: ABC transporter ATP-binding protein [Syntrophobacteraceae bacterium]|jgi:branched-chain amino acid transport system ATP-binding protein
MLSVRKLKCRYGNVPAINGINLSVKPGELVSLVGANGAGKTTLLQAICGFVDDWEGEIVFDNAPLRGLKPSQIVEKGISLVPEGRLLFPPLSVRENLKLGAYLRYRRHEGDAVSDDLKNILELFPILRQRAKQPAGTLSGGEQQMLAIARALMARPRLLVLDEPCMGLAPLLVTLILDTLAQLRQSGITILLVEQNARAALGIADRGYVLENGRIAMEGPASDLISDSTVRQAYLGKQCSRS